MTGVSKLSSNATRIKVGDNGSTIKIILSNIEEKPVSTLQYIRLTGDFSSYIEVTDYTLAEETSNQTTTPVMIRLPDLPKGVYEVEIMDSVGRIYPAEGRLQFDVVRSLEGGKQATFIDYKDEIIGELPAIVSDHMTANAELYKGAKGDKGDTVSNPPKTYTRAEYDALSTYDDNTLYIVKE